MNILSIFSKFTGLSTKIKIISIALIISVVGGYIGVLKYQNNSYRADIAELSLRLKTVQDNFDKCDNALSDQNKKIKNFEKQAQDNDKIIKDAKDKIESSQKEFDKLIKDLKNKPAPKTNDETLKYFQNDIKQREVTK